jgi:hypothetical protein
VIIGYEESWWAHEATSSTTKGPRAPRALFLEPPSRIATSTRVPAPGCEVTDNVP